MTRYSDTIQREPKSINGWNYVYRVIIIFITISIISIVITFSTHLLSDTKFLTDEKILFFIFHIVDGNTLLKDEIFLKCVFTQFNCPFQSRFSRHTGWLSWGGGCTATELSSALTASGQMPTWESNIRAGWRVATDQIWCNSVLSCLREGHSEGSSSSKVKQVEERPEGRGRNANFDNLLVRRKAKKRRKMKSRCFILTIIMHFFAFLDRLKNFNLQECFYSNLVKFQLTFLFEFTKLLPTKGLLSPVCVIWNTVFLGKQ